MQRKFPFLGIVLLYLLAGVELLAFPLLGAGTSVTGALSIQCFLFGCLCGAHMLVLRIIQELWQSSGGVFNVDEVLQTMVLGLEEELELRSQGVSMPSTGDSAEDRATPSLPSAVADTSTFWDPEAIPLSAVAPSSASASGSAAEERGGEGTTSPWYEPSLAVPESPLSRPQRRFLGRLGRALQVAVQVIGTS